MEINNATEVFEINKHRKNEPDRILNDQLKF